MSGAGRLLAFLAFLLIGASFVLQLINSIQVPYIKELGFLVMHFDTIGLESPRLLRLGLWGYYAITQSGNKKTSNAALNNYGEITKQIREPFQQHSLAYKEPIVKNLPYALVLQPIAAGFTGLAAGAALLAVCTNSFLWVLAAFWALALTAAALIIELILFIIARDRFRDLFQEYYHDSTQYDIDLDKGIWLQVAALASLVVGAFLLLFAYTQNKADQRARARLLAPAPSPAPMNNRDMYTYTTPTEAYAPYGQEPDYTMGGAVPYPMRSDDARNVYEEPYPGAAGIGAYAPDPYSRRYSNVYEEKEQPLPPETQLHMPEDQETKDHHEHRRRHKRRHSRGSARRRSADASARDRAKSSSDVPLRRSFEYQYDFDAFPARRMSYQYGGPKHTHHHHTTSLDHRLSGPRANSRSYLRHSHLYPDDSGEMDYDIILRRTANDEARWRALSKKLNY